jgi:hypothetical protein
MTARHVGGRPGFVNEDETMSIEIELVVEPGLSAPQDVRAILLAGVGGLLWDGPPLTSRLYNAGGTGGED